MIVNWKSLRPANLELEAKTGAKECQDPFHCASSSDFHPCNYAFVFNLCAFNSHNLDVGFLNHHGM